MRAVLWWSHRKANRRQRRGSDPAARSIAATERARGRSESAIRVHTDWGTTVNSSWRKKRLFTWKPSTATFVESAPIPGLVKKDRAGVLAALDATLNVCVSCHSAYKQQVVDEATWAKLTSKPAPSEDKVPADHRADHGDWQGRGVRWPLMICLTMTTTVLCR